MFEIPEMITLAKQMNASLCGKVVRSGNLGNSPHKFVWYNRTTAEFDRLVRGKTVGEARARGRWLLVFLEPGYTLLFGECGGKILLHPAGDPIPKKVHLSLDFEDGSALTATTQMWGAMELWERGQEWKREYLKDMRPTPVDPEFTPDYFSQLVAACAAGEKRSVKSLLTQEQTIPGLGNSIAQDILFQAGLHPRHALGELSAGQVRDLYAAIRDTVQEAMDQGGRNDEVDLYGRPGGYIRMMDKNRAGKPCPRCGHTVEKIQYLGGTCYFCPACQV